MCWWSSTLNAQPRCCPELSNAASTELNVMMSALSPSSVNQSKANCHWLPLAHAPQMISGNNYQCFFFFEILNLMCRICHICSVRGSDTVKSRCWWMRCTSQVSVGEFHLGEFPAAKVNVAILHLETYGNRHKWKTPWKSTSTSSTFDPTQQDGSHDSLLNARQGTLCTGTHHCIASNDIELQLFLLQRFEEKKGNLPLTWFLTGAYGCAVRNNIDLQAHGLIFQVSQQPNCGFPSGSLSTCMNCWVIGHHSCLQTLELQLIKKLQSYLPVFAFGTLWDCFVEINDVTIGLQSCHVFRFTCHA